MLRRFMKAGARLARGFMAVAAPAALAATLSCDKDDEPTGPIAKLCKQLMTCECSGEYKYPSLDACIFSFKLQGGLFAGIAEERGLIYEESCYGVRAERFAQEFTCETPGALDALMTSPCEPCQLVHGDRKLGESCEEDSEYTVDNCDVGLKCLSGICREACAPIPEGVRCDREGWGTGECAEGLYCSYQDAYVCQPRVGEGMPCGGNQACQDGLFCDDGHPDGTSCQPIPGAGEACSTTCAEGYACNEATGTCGPLPEVGEPCPHGKCADGAHCPYWNQVCMARVGEGESCDAHEACLPGLVCDGDTCAVEQAYACYYVGG